MLLGKEDLSGFSRDHVMLRVCWSFAIELHFLSYEPKQLQNTKRERLNHKTAQLAIKSSWYIAPYHQICTLAAYEE